MRLRLCALVSGAVLAVVAVVKKVPVEEETPTRYSFGDTKNGGEEPLRASICSLFIPALVSHPGLPWSERPAAC